MLTLIALALIVIVVRPWIAGWRLADVVTPRAALAQSEVPKYEVSLPRAWGKFVAFSNNNLLLETPDHVMRIVDVEGKAPEYPRVKVLIHWQ